MASNKKFTLSEVAKHNNEDSCWIVIRGKVYDVTDFLDEHPGGDSVLLDVAGKDGTEDFDSIGQHLSQDTQKLLEKYYIGELVN